MLPKNGSTTLFCYYFLKQMMAMWLDEDCLLIMFSDKEQIIQKNITSNEMATGEIQSQYKLKWKEETTWLVKISESQQNKILSF